MNVAGWPHDPTERSIGTMLDLEPSIANSCRTVAAPPAHQGCGGRPASGGGSIAVKKRRCAHSRKRSSTT
jgi:hypothetical protein